MTPEPAETGITISEADFQKFREFFYRKTGIQFDSSKRYFVDKRLVERIEATGIELFSRLFHHAALSGQRRGIAGIDQSDDGQ